MMTPERIPNPAIIVFLSIGLIGCGTSRGIETAANLRFADPSGVTLTSVAVLPMVTDDAMASYRAVAARYLRDAASGARPETRFIAPDTVAQLLNAADLGNELTAVIDLYRTTGVVNGEAGRAIAAELGVDHLLYSRIERAWNQVSVVGALFAVDQPRVVWEASADAAIANTGRVDALIRPAVIRLVERLPR